MRNIKYIFLLLLFISSDLLGQSLKGIQDNKIIKKYITNNSNLKKAKSLLQISVPFFEDFSNTASVFPNPAKWSDNYAFINNSFAKDPISFGVATLDAIDQNGDVYAITNSPASSDKLTSQTFNLSTYTFPDDTVRFSFFYQSGGNGETPEISDSLLLEFFYPPTSQWNKVWFSITDAPSEFRQVVMDIPSMYYLDGFRFRFRNYTSLSPQDVSGGEGALSNVDCWNIDYIMLNTDPVSTHVSINDIALTDQPRNMLDNYEIIPWRHLNDAQSITRNMMNFDIRILKKQAGTVNVGRSYYLKDLNSGYKEDYEEFFEMMDFDTLLIRYDPFFAPFISDDNYDEGLIEVGSYLVTPASQPKQNDTSRILLNFKDSYAYDDGSPEYGFGIEGPSTYGSFLAIKFRTYKPDTLRALDMIFNKARNNFNANLKFKICVWKAENNLPGELIYISPDEYSPELGTGGAFFHRYPITDEIIITDSVFFVGWKQLTEEFLNIGYDVNRNNNSRTYYNTNGNWTSTKGSIIPGTIMIRTVFGGINVITAPENPELQSEIAVFPNPANNILQINSEKDRLRKVSIIDITGRTVLQKSSDLELIDISNISEGIYQIILDIGKVNPIVKKVIIIR